MTYEILILKASLITMKTLFSPYLTFRNSHSVVDKLQAGLLNELMDPIGC